MSAPGYTTPLRAETFQNLQLNAGIFLKEFDYSNITDAAGLKAAIKSAINAGTKLLGATRGGGSFVATRETRDPEADGKRYPIKGGTFVDSVDARLSTTMIEITPDAFAVALGAVNVATSGNVTTITMKTPIGDDDYISNLCWVGDLADGSYVIIDLQNALNTADVNFTFVDKGEGTLPVEFHAYQDAVDDYDYAPFKIVFIEPGS